MKLDWTGCTYCGLTLKWNFKERWVDISIPGYIDKMLTKFQHTPPKRPQYSPHPAPEPQFGLKAQNITPANNSPLLEKAGKKFVRGITSSFLFYACMVDSTILKALNTIAQKQDKPTKLVKGWCIQLLGYAATYPNAKVKFWASDMILKACSNASYNYEENARSSFVGYFWLGDKQHQKDNLKMNRPVDVSVNLLKLVAASAAEAELGALFKNMQKATIMQLTLAGMGHIQPQTEIWVDNTTTHGIANSTFKQQRSWAKNMQYFWVIDQVIEKNFKVYWAPSLQNLADYFTKHHTPRNHQKVRPYYINMPTSL